VPLPSKRDPEALRQRLEQWFSARLGEACSVSEISIPEGTGMSSETLLFDLTHGDQVESLVARIRPDMDDWPVFPVYDMETQARAMQLVAERSDVPVPTVRFVEPDEAHLGAPFIVMERVEGRALHDMPPYVFGGSFLDELDAEGLRAIGRESAAVLARLHRIDLSGVDTSFIAADDGDALGRQLAEQRAYYDWARGDDRVPILVRALAWLEANRPDDPGPTVLNWGDARPGNILFDGLFDGLAPSAVLDWEMVNLGPAGVDVGWLIFMHEFFQHLAETFGLPGFPDFCRAEDVLADYQAAGGPPIEHLDWYRAFASTRFGIISLRTSRREVAYGNREHPDDPEDLLMHRDLLARHIGEA
jgi:aminoglycoside phosphotransferase (APT) family kinase protein